MEKDYKVIVERCEDTGVYVVTVPSLPGCVTQGGSREEALERIKEAIQGFLEALTIEGMPIPAP